MGVKTLRIVLPFVVCVIDCEKLSGEILCCFCPVVMLCISSATCRRYVVRCRWRLLPSCRRIRSGVLRRRRQATLNNSNSLYPFLLSFVSFILYRAIIFIWFWDYISLVGKLHTPQSLPIWEKKVEPRWSRHSIETIT